MSDSRVRLIRIEINLGDPAPPVWLPVGPLHHHSLLCVHRVSIKESSVAKLGSVCRRIYRIFSHAYFHHRQIFDKYEVG